jgi:hypothetical protein
MSDWWRDRSGCYSLRLPRRNRKPEASSLTEEGWCLHCDCLPSSWQLAHPGAARISIAPELYYLPDDPQETNNVIDANAGLAREIHKRYVAWLEAVGTPEEHLAGRQRLH